MKRNEFFNMIDGLFGYFRFKDSPKTETVDSWYESLKYVDADAVSYIKKIIEDLDNMPRNLPKAIKGAYAQYRRQNSKKQFVKYDSYDDVRYPIENLHTATETYIDKGREDFLNYCKTNYMPSQDIERCENKVKCLIDRSEITAIVSGIGESISDNNRNGDENRNQNIQKQKEKWND